MKLSLALSTLSATQAFAQFNWDPRSWFCNINNPDCLARKLTTKGIYEHLERFQSFADRYGGNRVFGTRGHGASAEYVAREMDKYSRDYDVDWIRFTEWFAEPRVATGAFVEPQPYEFPVALLSYTGSTSEEGVTAPVVAVGDAYVPDQDPTPGCEIQDYADLDVTGKIALVSRGACSFRQKADLAEISGAVGILIYDNQPQEEPFLGTLSSIGVGIPVASTIQEVGLQMERLLENNEAVLNLVIIEFREQRTTYDVCATTKQGDDNAIVMIGSHLDSVPAGPGINDNGSGSAALLEIAKIFRKAKPTQKVRFCWWSAEEFGLLGSTYYVNQYLNEEERAKVALYLNYDMIASPNYYYGIYDGDDSDQEGAPAGPPGSEHIEKTHEAYFEKARIPYKGSDFTGRSDYGPFIEVGIPAGGLFTGAEVVKTEDDAATFGGEAGTAYDECYHLECDTIENINKDALIHNSRVIAYTLATYARSLDGIPFPRPTGGVAGWKNPFIDMSHRPYGHNTKYDLDRW